MAQLQAMVVEWAANCSTRLKVEDAKAVEASDAAAEATRAAKVRPPRHGVWAELPAASPADGGAGVH